MPYSVFRRHRTRDIYKETIIKPATIHQPRNLGCINEPCNFAAADSCNKDEAKKTNAIVPKEEHEVVQTGQNNAPSKENKFYSFFKSRKSVEVREGSRPSGSASSRREERHIVSSNREGNEPSGSGSSRKEEYGTTDHNGHWDNDSHTNVTRNEKHVNIQNGKVKTTHREERYIGHHGKLNTEQAYGSNRTEEHKVSSNRTGNESSGSGSSRKEEYRTDHVRHWDNDPHTNVTRTEKHVIGQHGKVKTTHREEHYIEKWNAGQGYGSNRTEERVQLVGKLNDPPNSGRYRTEEHTNGQTRTYKTSNTNEGRTFDNRVEPKEDCPRHTNCNIQ